MKALLSTNSGAGLIIVSSDGQYGMAMDILFSLYHFVYSIFEIMNSYEISWTKWAFALFGQIN